MSRPKPSAPRRQDYILRVRYTNPLPPPPFPPKLLKIPVELDEFTGTRFSAGILQRRKLDVNVDPELGMPVDLSSYRGVFEGVNTEIEPIEPPSELDAKDVALLHGAESANALPVNTSFLRRTEYISSESAKTAARTALEASRNSYAAEEARGRSLTDPERQAQEIESAFAYVNGDISAFKHPKKPGLHAVESWSVLPNIEDQYDRIMVKFVDNPLNARLSTASSEEILSTSIITSETTEYGEEQLALFAPDADTAARLQAYNSTTDADKGEVFSMRRAREFYNSLQVLERDNEEVALVLKQDEQGREYYEYLNLRARGTLRRKRATMWPNKSTIFELRPRPYTQEEQRATKRSRYAYDPETYEAPTPEPDADSEEQSEEQPEEQPEDADE